MQASAFEYQCEWAGCCRRFPASRELFSHLEQDHLPQLPHQVVLGGRRRAHRELSCRWTGCAEAGVVFAARYRLLLHVQAAHCQKRGQRSHVSTTYTCTRYVGLVVQSTRAQLVIVVNRAENQSDPTLKNLIYTYPFWNAFKMHFKSYTCIYIHMYMYIRVSYRGGEHWDSPPQKFEISMV